MKWRAGSSISSVKHAAGPEEPRGFAGFLLRARRMLSRPGEVLTLVDSATRKLQSSGLIGRQFDQFADDLALLMRLTGSWARGEYREVSTRTLTIVVGALLYFVVPFDVVPDFIAGLGFVDDAAVIAYAVAVVHGELDTYRGWCAKRDEEAEGRDAT